MRSLRIRFAPQVESNGAAHLVLEVYSQTGEPVHVGLLEIDEEVLLDVDPGTYLVRMYMPNGEVLQQQAEVTVDADASVSLAPRVTSPSEHLAWAFYLHRAVEGGYKGRVYNLASDAWSPRDIAIELSLHSQGNWSWPRQERLESVVGLPKQMSIQRGSVAPVALGRIPNACWLNVRHGKSSFFTALPAGKPTVAIVGGDDGSVRVIAGGIDPDVEALLGFLAGGDFASARRLGPLVVQENVSDNGGDALALAAAGYYLLAAGDLVANSSTLTSIVNRLKPSGNGSILGGWATIRIGSLLPGEQRSPRGRRRNQTEETARHAWLQFSNAYEAGLPTLSIGLRYLIEGLHVVRAAGGWTVSERERLDQQIERLLPYCDAAIGRAGLTLFAAPDPNMGRSPELAVFGSGDPSDRGETTHGQPSSAVLESDSSHTRW